jgi:hypothetical protein
MLVFTAGNITPASRISRESPARNRHRGPVPLGALRPHYSHRP